MLCSKKIIKGSKAINAQCSMFCSETKMSLLPNSKSKFSEATQGTANTNIQAFT